MRHARPPGQQRRGDQRRADRVETVLGEATRAGRRARRRAAIGLRRVVARRAADGAARPRADRVHVVAGFGRATCTAPPTARRRRGSTSWPPTWPSTSTGTGVATVSIWMGILLTEKFRSAFDGHPDALAEDRRARRDPRVHRAPDRRAVARSRAGRTERSDADRRRARDAVRHHRRRRAAAAVAPGRARVRRGHRRLSSSADVDADRDLPHWSACARHRSAG